MRSVYIMSFLFLQFFCACSNETDRSDTTLSSENDADAARNFIRLVLDGKLDRARNMLVADTLNTQLFDAYERKYTTRADSIKRGYRESSIKIFSVRPVNDTVSIISYSNSYIKRLDSLKVVKDKEAWKVDLKYWLTPITR